MGHEWASGVLSEDMTGVYFREGVFSEAKVGGLRLYFQFIVPGAKSAPGIRSSRVTGSCSGGDRSRTKSPNRRMVWVMYGEVVARSSGLTGWGDAESVLAAAEMTQEYW